jgi:hypothetical protein
MILVDAIFDFIMPNRATTYLIGAPVALDDKDVF